ncbi:MAG: CRISPR-associated endoribonuclease Cas6 [Thermogemmatispora sp.]|uniref:CRISPR-associated endoribonuclease Cas6 n=1 Tax=Thermogemmatispora sp. TaxID=1968838 RepID=UPI00261930C6|nr:CRISPR-associated endoribonuclease Cas6 [Thermogemmatispora sp.]MBX5458527.1 CRISPR-associated endoribonuclease Cas6 [Thermogemmatispora sp.]
MSSGRGDEHGTLVSMVLRVEPAEPGWLTPSCGPQLQAAFLQLVRQVDPELSAWLHQPNQRRPYTLSLLHGFRQLSAKDLQLVTSQLQPVPVQPGERYWLRLTLLDERLIQAILRASLQQARQLRLCIEQVPLVITHILAAPHPSHEGPSWVAVTSFEELAREQAVQEHYTFEFASPTAFSKGQRPWGKLLTLFPEPAAVFESLARSWDLFAPARLRLSTADLTPLEIADWCADHLIVSHYELRTQYLPSSRFGQTGFLGRITYEVKGPGDVPQARWLTPLARLALFSGVGYKTAMGMGQARCLNVQPSSEQPSASHAVARTASIFHKPVGEEDELVYQADQQ